MDYIQLMIMIGTVMIIIDALIAFIIPVWVWWRQIQKKIKRFTSLLDEHLIDPLKKELMTAIETKLDKICNNEIPHMIEQQLIPVQNLVVDVRNDMIKNMDIVTNNIEKSMESMQDLQNALYRGLGASGQAGKSAKTMERLLLEKSIIEADPSKEKMIMGLRMAKSRKVFNQSEYDMILQLMSSGVDGMMEGMLGGMQIGTNQKAMSVLQTSPRVQGVPPPQEEGGTGQAEVGTVTNSRELLKSQLEQHLPKDAVNIIMKDGDAALKIKASQKARGDESNGKEKERKEKK